jgi:hypothetical protein
MIRSLAIDVLLFRALAPAGMCLPIRYPEMDVSSDFTIPAFGRHITVLMKGNFESGKLSVNRLRPFAVLPDWIPLLSSR